MTAHKPLHLVPQLRFPEFRDDPSWSAPQFADLYDFKRTNTLSRDKLNYETGTIRNIHYGDIHTKFKPLFRVDDEYVPYVNADDSSNEFDDDAFCEIGDIVFADASEDLDDVGKAIEVVSLDGERVVAGTHTILGTRRESVPVVGFGGQLFQSVAVRSGIKKEAQGTKVYGISAKRISAVPIPIPPTVVEQKKIADCLGSLDDLIAAEGQKLDALRQHKQGLMQLLFPQPGATVPRLRFPEFRDTPVWAQTPLGDAFKTITNGQENAQDHQEDGAYPLFDRSELVKRSPTFLFDAEAVILPGEGMRFQPRYFNGKFNLHQRAYALMEPTLDPRFAFQALDRFKGALADSAVKSTVLSLRMPIIEKFAIPCPTIDAEQQKIADCLGSLDDLIAAEGRKLDALRQHKQGLMQKLFPSLDGQ